MAKRPVKRAASASKKPVVPEMETHTCVHKGCKSRTVYMRRNRKTGAEEHWCASHFQTDVIDKNKKAYLDSQPKREPFVEPSKRHPRKSRAKGGALKPAANRAMASSRRRVVKK